MPENVATEVPYRPPESQPVRTDLADIALPLILILGMAFFCLTMVWKTLRSDPVAYERHRRRAGGSMKNIVLGNVAPGDNYYGGMASRHTPDGKIVIVRTNQITQADLDELR